MAAMVSSLEPLRVWRIEVSGLRKKVSDPSRKLRVPFQALCSSCSLFVLAGGGVQLVPMQEKGLGFVDRLAAEFQHTSFFNKQKEHHKHEEAFCLEPWLSKGLSPDFSAFFCIASAS